MKFEQLLQIYWSRGFLYGGKVTSYDMTFDLFFENAIGLADASKKKFIRRFECRAFALNKLNETVKLEESADATIDETKNLSTPTVKSSEKKKDATFLIYSLEQRKIFNMYLSELTNINNEITETIKYSMVRIYLIKTFRGRCYALGKPARGQRT